MSSQNHATKALRELVRAFAALEGEANVKAFLLDLCTPAELDAMAGRWQAARLVAEHTPYRDIASKTGLSTATITRVARCVTYGAGGYRAALRKQP